MDNIITTFVIILTVVGLEVNSKHGEVK